MSEKRGGSQEREDDYKRHHKDSQEYDPEEFVPEEYVGEEVEVSTSDTPQEQQRVTEEYNPEEFVPLDYGGEEVEVSTSDTPQEQQRVTEEYNPEEFVPVDYVSEEYVPEAPIIFEIISPNQLEYSPMSSHTSSEASLGDLLFDETLEEVLEYRDTLSTPTYMPSHFAGITMDDYNYLLGRQPIAYHIVDNLGKGSFGCVLKAGIVVHNGFVAIKVYKVGVLAANIDNLIAEVRLIRKLKASPHNHILRCFAFCKHPDTETYYLIAEHSPLTDLFTTLQVKNTAGNVVWLPLDEPPIRHLIRGIGEGLRHLHGCGVAHADLKLENVLIFWNKNSTAEQRTTPVSNVVEGYQRLVYLWIPKLADFNNSLCRKNIDPPGEIWYHYPRCTINYAAPESWSSTPGMLPNYDAIKADAFSLGCCALAMALCSHPFKPENMNSCEWPKDTDPQVNEKRVRFIKSCNAMKRSHDYAKHLCRHLSPQMKRVVLKLLDPNPDTRLTVNKFVSDQWFTKPQSYDDIDAHKHRKSPKQSSISYEYH